MSSHIIKGLNSWRIRYEKHAQAQAKARNGANKPKAGKVVEPTPTKCPNIDTMGEYLGLHPSAYQIKAGLKWAYDFACNRVRDIRKLRSQERFLWAELLKLQAEKEDHAQKYKDARFVHSELLKEYPEIEALLPWLVFDEAMASWEKDKQTAIGMLKFAGVADPAEALAIYERKKPTPPSYPRPEPKA